MSDSPKPAPLLTRAMAKDAANTVNGVAKTAYGEAVVRALDAIASGEHEVRPASAGGPEPVGEVDVEVTGGSLSRWVKFFKPVPYGTRLYAAPTAAPAETEREALNRLARKFDLDNHHNAALCPYCSPDRSAGGGPPSTRGEHERQRTR